MLADSHFYLTGLCGRWYQIIICIEFNEQSNDEHFFLGVVVWQVEDAILMHYNDKNKQTNRQTKQNNKKCTIIFQNYKALLFTYYYWKISIIKKSTSHHVL